MKPVYRNILLFLVLPLFSLLLHLRIFNYDLIGIHVWRQTQTQTVINNFYEEDNSILNPRINARGDGDGIYRMEFPLMQWMIAQSYLTPDHHIFITRVWMFVTGLLSAFGMYVFLLNLFRAEIKSNQPARDSETIALLGAWAFYFSPAIYYYTLNPLPDNFALCCITWFLAFFFKWRTSEKKIHFLLSGLFLALGTLVKLPFILFFILPVSYFVATAYGSFAEKIKHAWKQIFVFSLFSVPALMWYAWAFSDWTGNPVLTGGFEKENRSIGLYFSYLWHNAAVTLPEILINYAALPVFLAGLYPVIRHFSFKKPVLVCFFVTGMLLLLYFFYELNAIHVSHDYYLFPFLPLIFCIVAKGISEMMQYKRWSRAVMYVLIFLTPVTAYLRMNTRWNEERPGFNKNLLVYKEDLRNAVPGDALCITGNDDSRFIFMYYIHKKGWNFNNDRFTSANIDSSIMKGAEYLYCDSRKIDTDTSISNFFEKEVMRAGDIRVYQLKANK